MITITISDKELEKRIVDDARETGISTQEFVENILSESTKHANRSAFASKKLDPNEYVHILNFELSEEELVLANDPSVKPFSDITDSAEYIHQLRRNIYS